MRKLLSLLNIHPGEARLVGLLFAYGVLVYMANVFTQTVCLSLFLNSYSASTLPYTYIGISIFATAVSMLYLRLNTRFSLSLVLVGNLIVLTLMLILYRMGIGLESAPWLVFTLPIYFGIANILTITAFWNLLGRLFNLQQGKRLFNLLLCSENIATILVGFFVPVLVRWFGTLNLFLIAAGLLAAALGLLIVIVRGYAPLMRSAQAEPLREQPETRHGQRATRYLVFMGVSVALCIVSIYLIDNLFYAQVATEFTSEAVLTSFLGTFFGMMGVISLLLQVFVFGWVLKRFGVRCAILITPVLLTVCMLLFALVGMFSAQTAPLFGIIVSANLFRLVMDPNDLSAFNILFQALPSQQRTSVQTIVDGIIAPLARGIAGVLLLVLIDGLGFTALEIAALLLVILAAWVTLTILIGREYPRQLLKALTGERSATSMWKPSKTSVRLLRPEIELEAHHAALLLSALHNRRLDAGSETQAAEVALAGTRRRIFDALEALYSAETMTSLNILLEPAAGEENQEQAVALEMLDVMLPHSLKAAILPIFALLSPAERLEALNRALPQTRRLQNLEIGKRHIGQTAIRILRLNAPISEAA